MINARHVVMSEVHANFACTVSVANDGGVWIAVLLLNFMYAAEFHIWNSAPMSIFHMYFQHYLPSK